MPRTENAMGNLELFYGDLHWHTRYSDNRDGASVDRMVREGVRHGYRVLGTGDHNHNLTAAGWRSECEESAHVAAGNPDIALLNNCEMTFLIGHFLAIQPGAITGTIDEANEILFGERDATIMVNHPGITEWLDRIVPHACALELINGAVIRNALREGWRIDDRPFPSALPSVEIWQRYLDAGIELAAVGSSDAHAVSELGTGCTGFWLSGGDAAPSVRGVLEAIRKRRTFAATDSGAMLRWRIGTPPGGGARLEWECAFSGGAAPEVSVFERRRLAAAGGATGAVAVEDGGIYWIAARSGDRFAFSSTISPPPRQRPARGRRRTRLSGALAIDRARARFVLPQRLDGPLGTVASGEEMELYCADGSPELVDLRGRPVEVEVLAEVPPRAVIAKDAGPEALEEFLVWFERNEIHEYRFDGIEISLQGELLTLRATMLPAWADRRSDRETRAREHVSRLLLLRKSCRECRIDVVVPRRLTIRFTSTEGILPLESASGRAPSGRPGGVPRGTILRLPIPGGTRLDQFFLDARGEEVAITRQGYEISTRD